MIMYRNPGRERGASVDLSLIEEFRPFSHFTTPWRDYPSPVVGGFLFVAFWLGFAGSIESARTAADLAGTAIFAFTGCLVSFRQFKPVSVGIALLAGVAGGFLTAVGGGTLRTFLLGWGPDPLFWVDNGRYGIAIGLGLLLALLWEPKICVRCEAHWNAADRMALAVFAPLGAEQALRWGAESTLTLMMVAAFLGFLTGAGGGVLRDLLRLRPPTALWTPYGWIAALGAAFHLGLLQAGVPMAWVVSAAVIYLLAESTHRWDGRSRAIRAAEDRWIDWPPGRARVEAGARHRLTPKTLTAEVLLLLAAVIWGFGYVAQRVGMDHVGPFTYNGTRFALGALSLLPLLWLGRRSAAPVGSGGGRPILGGGLLAGLLLFGGTSLQQVGIVHTTAGKAGFITGLYVVIVPALGLFWGHRTPWSTWAGAALAVAGLYLLTLTDDLSLAEGDGLVLIGAFFWAGHVLVIGWLSGRHLEPVALACLQFIVCAALSLAVAVATEPITLSGLWSGALPILYGGLLSVGVAFTLQVVAQRDAPPARAAILLSLETGFAALGGWWLLYETLSGRGIAGCALMFAGIVLSGTVANVQVWNTTRPDAAADFGRTG
jgi:drug/metabolite transporter (DMT)-like permease/uncharacterized membrane protein YeiH